MPSARSLPLAELLPDTPDGGSGRPWPVTGRYDPVPWLAVDGETGRGQLDGRFAGQRWQVEIVSSKGEEDDAFLIAGGKRQWLFKASRNGIDVVWAGDLDGDGKLDLFIRDSDEGPTFYLFLSSAALPGELLHAVATGFASSC